MTVPIAVRLQLRQVGRDGAPFSSVGLLPACLGWHCRMLSMEF